MNKDKIFVIGFDKSGETIDRSPSDLLLVTKKCLETTNFCDWI